jgi:UDP-N-acetylglucosamine 2-epimerase (non-hydrolysing)
MSARPKVMVVIGTRPEAIKMAPVIKELRRSELLDDCLCVTGQHRDMLDQVLEIFDLVPDYDLNLMRPNQALDQLTARVLTEMTPVLKDAKPDVVLVHGDTTTTLGAALSAFLQGVAVGHVEAGLRSYDLGQPFPEEMNRVLTDRLCRYHFAPTELAKKHLEAEAISTEHVVVTGNTAIDAVELALPQAQECEVPGLPDLEGKRILLVTAHRRESFGDTFRDMCLAIREIVDAFSDVAVVYPVHLNPNVQGPVHEILGEHPRIHLLRPLSYLPFLKLMSDSTLVLTDSGGLQEEAPSLNKPVLVMRELTERPEGVESGVLKLVGTQRQRIVAATTELLSNEALYRSMADKPNPYGDGQAARRIVRYLEADLT